MHKELKELMLALDEWEAAEDQAAEAAAKLSDHAALQPQEIDLVRRLRRATAQKLAQVRNALGPDFRPSTFVP